MQMAQFVRGSQLKSLGPLALQKLAVQVFLGFNELAQHREIQEMNMYHTLNQQRHIQDEIKHLCKSCRQLHCTFSGVYKSMLTALVFYSLVQKHVSVHLERQKPPQYSYFHPGQSKATVGFPQLPARNGITHCLPKSQLWQQLTQSAAEFLPFQWCQNFRHKQNNFGGEGKSKTWSGVPLFPNCLQSLGCVIWREAEMRCSQGCCLFLPLCGM